MSLRHLLSHRVSLAMQAAGIPAECQPHVAPSKNANFGDYQANGAMGAAKAMKSNPRAIAQSIIEHLDLEGIASNVEIAGPGFINIHLNNAWLGEQTLALTPNQSVASGNKDKNIIESTLDTLLSLTDLGVGKELFIKFLEYYKTIDTEGAAFYWNEYENDEE